MRTFVAIIGLLLVLLTARGASDFTAASSEYGVLTTTPQDPTLPCTLAILVQPDGLGSTRAFLSWNSATNSRIQLFIDSSDFIAVRSVNSAGSGSSAFIAPASSGVADGQWISVVGVVNGSANRVLYINGVSVATNTGAATPTGLDRILVGALRNSGSYGSFMNGALAYAAIWTNVALSETEISVLGNTNTFISPRIIRPEALFSYNTLNGSSTETFDEIRGPMTMVNTPGAVDHPRSFGD